MGLKRLTRTETFNFFIIKEQLSFDHYLIVVYRKLDDKMLYAGKVNWKRFTISMNGQVNKGIVKMNKRERKLLEILINRGSKKAEE